MLTAETKRRIDGARQVLVGVLPNPMQQVDLITTALIYKFMDDMDEQARKLGGKGSFFTGDFKQYSWHELMDSRLGNQEKLNLFLEALKKIPGNEKIPQLFRDIFKNVYLPFNDPRVLGLFLSEIDQFQYDNSEELGNTYEYLLSIMGSQGDAGQFRTPRHVIDFIVKAIDPQKEDRILDPACGTGGFLISAYKHILEAHDGLDNKTGEPTDKEKALTSDERAMIHKNITGYDIDPNMVRTAQVNTYLHKFKNPDIRVYDSLSSVAYWDEEYDIILANPPFMTPKGGIEPHSKFSIKANRAEVLFVDYIVEHLSTRGRAGIIVPEGIIFQSANAYKKLRKILVEDGLYAVVSLPSGVFSPYSGVKTSILLFDKDITKKKKEVLFIKIENDGFDLGAQRRETPDKNDLPQALEILKEWKEKQKVKKDQNIAFAVKKSEIAESGDYNLTGERYREVVDYSNVKWEMVELEEVCNLESGSRQKGGAVDKGIYSIGGQQISGDNVIRFEKMKYITEKHFSGMKKGILFQDDVLMVKDGATTGKMGFWNYNYKAAVNEHVFIFRANDKILPKYLYNVLWSNIFQQELKQYIKGIIGGISLEIKKIKIPLPPLEIQKQIVEELDSYQKVIDGAKQVVENWKPNIKIESDWEVEEVGNICEIKSGGTPKRGEKKYWNGDIPWFSSGELNDVYIKKSKEKITEEGLNNSNSTIFPVGSLLIGMYDTAAFKMSILKAKASFNQAICGIKPNNKINIYFLYLYFLEKKEEYLNLRVGVRQRNLNKGLISSLKIPIPPLKTQEKIVAEIEAEQEIVNQNKKLIEIFKKKIKTKISEVWGE
jgi:type I restriction enzyme M protein